MIAVETVAGIRAKLGWLVSFDHRKCGSTATGSQSTRKTVGYLTARRSSTPPLPSEE